MEFDLIVLGGGSGGIATAVRAAKHGAKVALIEQTALGGTCVNLGCVPKKVMFNTATLAEHLHKATDYGFAPVPVHLDWQALVHKRQAYIQRLHENYRQRLQQHQIQSFHGHGSLIDAHSVQVGAQRLRANHILIATGGEPVMPPMPGIEHAINSDGFFALQQRPAKTAIIGSGYIGVELAGIMQALGSETHVFMRGQLPLSRFDRMLGEQLLIAMRQQGIKVYLDHQAREIGLQPDQRRFIRCPKDSLIGDFDCVIMAVGRQPRTRGIGLEALGLAMDDRGLIKVDAWQNSSIAGIYAIGDVTDAPALTPVAIAAGRKLADRLFGGQTDAKLDYQNICSVIFTHPPIGTVGLSEQEAIARYGEANIKVYRTQFNPMWDALSEQKTPTAMKLVTLGAEEKIIGLHIFGYHADEILQGFGVAIKMGACKKDFDSTVAIHPTSAEELVTMV